MGKLGAYHYIWLSTHTNRTEEWLRDKLREGFDIHHIDGNHSNNSVNNLVLIESADHMFIHNGKTRALRKLSNNANSKSRKSGLSIANPIHCEIVYSNKQDGVKWQTIAALHGITISKAKHMYERHKSNLKPLVVREVVTNEVIKVVYTTPLSWRGNY